ncbi:protein kinase family protein [Simkania negevensis]|uniref:PI3K/PI4K catalytic domain-containing protein n=1 Tax=Simkania negevensis (strain ATCC VR-1471 / DSM 27360 / Z) TaxID=331113 RepID=F8L8K6_SIMNZ|nr:hypothetical protein [Simkania negevensis]CCB89140.1 hypothetical protein SNE_A12630 [Simkania negevensis Z]
MTTVQTLGQETTYVPLRAELQVRERQVKILSDTPLETSFYIYGKAINAITYAFFSFLMPVLYTIFSSFRHHVVEMINLKGDLAQNKFDALQKILDHPDYDEIVLYADRKDYIAFYAQAQRLGRNQTTQPEVLELARQLIPYSLIECVKDKAMEFAKEAGSSLCEEFKAIRTDEPGEFLRQATAQAEGYPEVQKKLQLLKLATLHQMDLSKELVINCAKETLAKNGFDETKLRETLEVLTNKAAQKKDVKQFLIEEKTFGTDPSSKIFQAGYLVLMNHLEPYRDRQFAVVFFDLIQNLRNSSDEGRYGYNVGHKIRDLAFLASQSPLYQRMQNQSGRSNLFVALLQDLCTTLQMKVPGMRELRQLGGMYLDQIKEAQGEFPEEGQKITYLAKSLDRALEKHRKFSFESFRDRALTDNGHFDLGVGQFQVGDRTLHAAFGPTHKNDKALEMHLESLKERGGIHLHQGLAASSFSLRQLASEYPTVMRVFSMPLDGFSHLSEEEKRYFLQFKTAEEFLMKYAKYALCNQTSEDPTPMREISTENHLKYTGTNDNGFYFGQNVMSTDQFKLAFEKSVEAFSHVNPAVEDPERLARALQLGAQGFLTVGAIVKTLQDLPPGQKDQFLSATYKQAFEKNVDRGIVMHVLIEVYFHLLSGDPLTEEAIQEMIGAVIARAELIVGYKVTMSDYQQLSDLLRMIGADETRVRKALQSYVKDGFAAHSVCKFEPLLTQAPDRAKRRKITTEREIFEGRKQHPPTLNKGSYGSVIYRDRKGKPYGIFKAIDAHFSFGKRFKSKALHLMRITGQEGYLPLPEMRQVGAMISERATYLLDHAFDAHSVPKTEIIYAQGHKGSFQHFVHGYKEAQEVDLPTEVTESELTQFQKFAIIDYILGNLDRKEDNWMVKMSEDGKSIDDIKMIDNANCFPRGHLPLSYLPDGSTWNQYAWKSLPLSEKPLTKNTMHFIESLTGSKVARLIQTWKRDLGREYFEAFFGGDEGEVIKAFLDRVNVVRKFKEQSELAPQNVRELATYNTYEAIDGYLGSERKAARAQYTLPTYS